VAVSDHLLLGGDNIDLAIAHRLESRLSDKPLAPAQWNFLVARCRDLKEQCFSNSALDAFPVAVPSRGSTLLGGTLSCRITRAEIEEIVLAGFFPDCALESEPAKAHSGLREWALPYAADSGVTRYLAEFLNHRPPIDAVLFNGGSLYPQVLRERLVEQIGRWQNGARPRMLINSEPSLAVARGAARFGKIVHHRSRRIEADAARSLYLEVHKKPGQTEQNAARTLLCILAAGSPTEEEFQIADVGLELRVNRAVRFQAFSSTRRPGDRIGQLVIWNEQEFRQLPSLQTTAKLSSRGSGGDRLPVSLRVYINELGLLRIACVSAQPGIRETWPLEFNLRADEEPRSQRGESGSEPRSDAGIGTVNLESAKTRIRKVFSQPLDKRDKLSAANLLKSLERMAGVPKAGWNWGLVRSFWQTLAECHPDRSRSIEHDETWLILAGFFLRPGFGGDGDEYRIDRLWHLQKERPANPSKRIQIQQFVLWRRVAGGLDRERQNEILAPEMPLLAGARNASPELVRLAGAFEKIEVNRKIEVFHLFLGAARELAAGNRSCAPYLSSLGLLLNRAPLCANSDSVLPADLVEEAFDALSSFEWSEPDLGEVQTLFLRAARVVDDSKIDLPKALRQKIASRLERLGVPPTKLTRIRSFVPMGTGDRASLFGEALPPGLVLRE
jgi:hypothetical protein